MGSKAIPKSYRPRNIGSNGMIVTIDKSQFGWLDKLLNKYYQPQHIWKLLNNLPRIGAIRITDGDELLALIVLTPRSDPKQIQIDHFSGNNETADFSILMILKAEQIKFRDLTPDIGEHNFLQVSNFVIGVHVYEALMHTDTTQKYDTIEPVEVFGQSLV